ncbi:hypothetical protein ACVWYH_007081 [Bradyrhizobium sp. GM24.11]
MSDAAEGKADFIRIANEFIERAMAFGFTRAEA